MPNNLIKNKNNKLLKKFRVLQKPPVSSDDVYVRSNPSKPLWMLASEYYNDPTMWKIIAIANDLSDQIVDDGRILRIPIGVQQRYIVE
jgi:prophage DNA circulation protein